MHIMQSHYNINVTRRVKDSTRKDGFRTTHFFRVLVEHSGDPARIYFELRDRFPESEGYGIDVTEWIGSGHVVNPEEDFSRT